MTATRTAGLTPRFAEGDPMRVIGLAERYEAGTMGRIPEQWQRLETRLGEVRGRTDERSSACSIISTRARSRPST
jgi:predicted transcriptional regulator YdeE